MKKARIEILRYEQAEWAPQHPGANWAWRVTGLNGACIRGSVRGTRKEALAAAQRTARRLDLLQRQGVPESGFVLGMRRP